MSTSRSSRRAPIPKAPRRESYSPAEWDPEDAYAVQAFMHGRADQAQQLRAARFILERICCTYDLSFRPESERETSFAEGKRFVGLQLVKFANLNVAQIRGKQTEQGDTPKEQPT